MSAMGDLRLSLLEHGVNYDEYGDGYTHWNYGGASYTAQQNIVGKLIVCNLTPAQAVEATLGREECEDIGDPGDFCCSECGVRMFTSTNDTYTMITSDGRTIIERPNYCPNCGRQVKQ